MTNQTPQSTFDEKLDEIIEYFVQERDAGFDKIHQRFLKGEITIEQQVQLSEIDWDKHISEAKAAITSLILEEVIGENDVRRNPSGRTHQRTVNNRNQLRAEQRSIITKELK